MDALNGFSVNIYPKRKFNFMNEKVPIKQTDHKKLKTLKKHSPIFFS